MGKSAYLPTIVNGQSDSIRCNPDSQYDGYLYYSLNQDSLKAFTQGYINVTSYIYHNAKEVVLENFHIKDFKDGKFLLTEVERILPASRVFVYDLQNHIMDTLSVRGKPLFSSRENEILVQTLTETANFSLSFFDIKTAEQKVFYKGDNNRFGILALNPNQEELLLYKSNGIFAMNYQGEIRDIILNDKITNIYFSENLNRFYYFKYNKEAKGYYMIRGPKLD